MSNLRKLASVLSTTIISNVVYAGVRAKNEEMTLIEPITLFVGFPFTLISMVNIYPGSGRIYGMQIFNDKRNHDL